jgi:hypothetical protein
MSNNKREHIKSAKESLNEMLKRIGPYMPKPRYIKREEPKRWKLVSGGEIPPLKKSD